MGRYASEPQGGDFEKTPEGTHLGICYRIIDLGTTHGEYEGKETIRNRVMISWELPNELMADGRPFSISGFYTNSLSEKAKLRAHLAAWRGRDFTKDELERFDLANILDKAALINVGRTEKGKEKVVSVVSLPKGMTIPKRYNELQTFFLDEWDDAVWAQIPDGIKRMITESDEYKNMKGIATPEEETEPEVEGETPF